MLRALVLSSLLGSFVTSSGVAQGVSAVILPNPVLPGSTVSVTVTEANGTSIVFTTPCGFDQVRADSPTGPVINASPCPLANTPVSPWGSVSGTWNVSGFGPGTYWLRMRYWDANLAVLTSEWCCLQVAYPFTPTLTAQTPAQVGQDLLMTLGSGFPAGTPYVAAASYTTNQGLPLGPGNYLCLDIDFLFDLSFPIPLPGLFSNFIGVLDANGSATGLTVHLPNIPFLQCKPLHVQAAVLPPSGLELTNVLNFTIAP